MNINQGAAPLKNPLCVALDVDDEKRALDLVDQLSEVVGGFKIGPRLILRYGQILIHKISKMAPVFVDCKYFDIPSTMEAAVRASFEAGASLVTIHAMAGSETLQRLAKVEQGLSAQRPFRILAVTILTSWDEKSLPTIFKSQKISEHVQELARLVKHSGLNSVVCSPHEIDLLKNQGLYLLTPGIRFAEDASDDQKRIMGPFEAMQKGSSALVVGRPIIEAKNPLQAATEYLTAIYEAKK